MKLAGEAVNWNERLNDEQRDELFDWILDLEDKLDEKYEDRFDTVMLEWSKVSESFYITVSEEREDELAEVEFSVRNHTNKHNDRLIKQIKIHTFDNLDELEQAIYHTIENDVISALNEEFEHIFS